MKEPDLDNSAEVEIWREEREQKRLREEFGDE